MTLRLLAFIATLFAFASAQAQISPAVKTGHANTRLVSEVMAGAPGETITIALAQELEDHWHVYWKNPGDSGLPLNLDWTLPDGFAAGDIAYPLPHRLSLGPLVNYGHEGEPVFLVQLKIPESAPASGMVHIKVDASWLICADICVPEEATLTMALPMAETLGGATLGVAERIAAAKAEQPVSSAINATYYDSDRGPVLQIADLPAGKVEFYPYTPSLIEHAADVDQLVQDGVTYLGHEAGFVYQASAPNRIGGVLTVENSGQRTGYEIFAERVDPPAQLPAFDGQSTANTLSNAGARPLLFTLVLALLGGLALNVMPCVFPIVFLKAAGFAAVARAERGTIRLHGLLYTAGVLVTFVSLAAIMLVMRAGGEEVGWGYHLQSPVLVGSFAIVIFLVGLNLAGVFEIGTSVQGLGDSLASQGGKSGAFFTGLLAVAVAAPCVGPLLGSALGAAISRPAIEGLLIFGTIGLGLALPYLLFSFVPSLVRLLPKPGPWMVIMKQLFAFAMFGTLVWLAWVVVVQTGSAGMLRLGTALVVVGLAAWLFGLSQKGHGGMVARIGALALLVMAFAPISQLSSPKKSALEAVTYNEAVLATLQADGVPVFVDFTAAWCITCQFNKRTVLNTKSVVAAFDQNNVTYMVADWTVQDPVITAALERQGRAGVPLYLYYRPGSDAPVILPQMLSIDGVIDTIKGVSKGSEEIGS